MMPTCTPPYSQHIEDVKMILNAFQLTGKIALITVCNTRLGQVMDIALAEDGCDIIGVNRSEPDETAARMKSLGRRFYGINADSSDTAAIPDILS